MQKCLYLNYYWLVNSIMIRTDGSFGLGGNSEYRWGVLRISTLASLILFSAFGPYINSALGLRLEQLVIYISFFLLVITGNLSVPRSPSLSWMLLCFSILLFVPILTLYQGNYIRLSLVVAQFENYLQAPIVLLIFLAALQRASCNDHEDLFSRLTIILLYMLAINTVFSLYTISNPASELVRIFTGSREITADVQIAGMTSAEASIGAGRVTGVFGQVFEGGYAYSLGLFLWVFNYKGTGKGGWLPYSLLLMILIGGTLSFSKVFLVLGLPLFLLCFGVKRVLLLAFFIGAAALLAMWVNPLLIGKLAELKGLWGLFRLFDLSVFDFVTVYTSSRFSGDTTIISSILNVLSVSPLIGLGYGSIETSDFSLNEVISQGGLIGLIAYLWLHTLLVILAFRVKKGPSRTLYLSFLAITFLTGIAAPVITANRISVFIWLIVAWALCGTVEKSRKPLRDV